MFPLLAIHPSHPNQVVSRLRNTDKDTLRLPFPLPPLSLAYICVSISVVQLRRTKAILTV
jgi:hypothetical protein